MNAKRYVNTQRKAESRITDLISRTKACKFNQRKVTEQYNQIIVSLPKDTPEKLKQFLRGVFETHMKYIYNNELEFCYVLGGKFYTINKKSDKPYWAMYYDGKAQCIPKGTVCGTVWKGTEKFFFESTV